MAFAPFGSLFCSPFKPHLIIGKLSKLCVWVPARVESKGKDDHINHRDLCVQLICYENLLEKSSDRGNYTWDGHETIGRREKKKNNMWPYQACHAICGSLIPSESHLLFQHTYIQYIQCPPDTPDPPCHPKLQARTGKELVGAQEWGAHAHAYTPLTQTCSTDLQLIKLCAFQSVSFAALAADSCAFLHHHSNTILSLSLSLHWP